MATLENVIDETRLVFHRLRWVAEVVHGKGDLSASLRGVLLDLERHGSRTVPQIARSRPVSRQHIQLLVNSLLEDGLVELGDNTRHRRSKLVRLTEAGKELVEDMKRRESRLLLLVAEQFSTEELEQARHVLRRLRMILSVEKLNELMEEAFGEPEAPLMRLL
ncbi:MAG: MarR family transcriptional regulator [Thermoanaerobaculia bacterium]